MKILIIHNRYQSNNVGGEDIVYQNELESLQKALGKDSVLSYEVSNDDISKVKLLYGIWFSLKHYKNVKKIVRENNIDIVHVHNFFPLLTPSIFRAAKKAGAKVVHTLHNYRLWCISGILYRDGHGVCELCVKKTLPLAGISNKCYRKSFIQSLLAQFAFSFYKVAGCFKNIDYFFVLTNFQKQKIKSLGVANNKIKLKPNGMKISQDVIDKQKHGYIYVGRLEESKGIYALLDAWSKLGKEYVLTIIGDGDITSDLKAKYNAENIIFKGKCSREDTLSYISKSKYLIQPSLLYEAFGLTIIEAMSYGVPVIGFDVGTRKDFIKDQENGFLATDNNLQDTIKKSYNYSDYDKLSVNAMKTAKLYENDYITGKQIEIYRDILGSVG
ncbi:glycosyltransferase family 4 protein [Francisella adeliensis]|uniref:Glycosyl transferase family 1 n=1 Tax=Francisella adeliensis TaxID=2007306 RepID=A0A2Z4XXE9_9GAMM|nr:glycosyltransferase family 4 protein [Francisella adeliensis]AXA33406.1 glycosyl transferase family 1 [Francisella adeliensis]MBK2085423.1 glycosyltransferase family 4 protein [Francisella adeliensis]MBK2097153.1 glycosyltransferase family 4 protein [Francisella adeliensis]QIW11634.1 glycosyltransferase family 4 protein [Francisella adeliensis]QIW13509.1 glycosyltransferase family 4 protein [Francisella adeliensis]